MNPTQSDLKPEPGSAGLLALGGFGAVLLSACCVLPFALVMLGLGGAWLANLHALYPYRWLFLTASGVVLWLAWRRLYRPAMVCADGTACAVPKARRFYRLLFWLLTALTTISAAAPYLLGTLLR